MSSTSNLTYARPGDSKGRKLAIHTVETLSGKRRLAKTYRLWQKRVARGDANIFNLMLAMMRIRIGMTGTVPEPSQLPERIVVVANHPLGIGDGVAILALAERLGRPFRILINNDLMKVPEMAAYGLPVSFEETKEAVAMNLKTRKQAVELLEQGVTIVVFPAGAVATAPKPFARALDFPWKQFTARLVQQGRASVLPVWFEGQNGPLFHFVSRYSLTLRLALLIGEFRRLRGREIRMHVGALIRETELSTILDRKTLTDHLRQAVFALSPSPVRMDDAPVRIAA